MYSCRLFKLHTMSHVESVEENTGNPYRNRRQLEDDGGLLDEIDALGPPESLLGDRHAVYDARGAQYLCRSEEPLFATLGARVRRRRSAST